MAPMMVPTADPDHRGGRRFDLHAGAAFTPRDGLLQGQRFALEYMAGPFNRTSTVSSLKQTGRWAGSWGCDPEALIGPSGAIPRQIPAGPFML